MRNRTQNLLQSRPPVSRAIPPRAIAPLFYHPGKWFFRTAIFSCVHLHISDPAKARERAGGYVLACTHLSHLEPVIVGDVLPRQVEWVTRIEFFRKRLNRWYLRAVNAIPVNRTGVAKRALCTAIARAQSGRIVGIFPEGGVPEGLPACEGGAMKNGFALIAMAAQVPIVPCLIVGTDQLNSVKAWIPWRRQTVSVYFGEAIEPGPSLAGRSNSAARRAQRARLATELRHQYVELFRSRKV